MPCGSCVARAARGERIAQAAAEVALEHDDLGEIFPPPVGAGGPGGHAPAHRHRPRPWRCGPDFIFFDEPFTALDVALRRRMQDLVIATCAAGHCLGPVHHPRPLPRRRASPTASRVLDTRGRRILGDNACWRATPAGRTDEAVFTHGCRQRCGRIRCSGTSTMSTKGRSHELRKPAHGPCPGPCRLTRAGNAR